MSSLLDTFLADLSSADPKWVEGAVAAGKSELANIPPDLQPSVNAMLDRLAVHAPDIVSFGPQVYALMLSHLEAGSVDSARLIYLATVASQQERDDALDAATDAAMKAQQQSDAAWAEAKAVALDILEAGAKAAIPLLITCLLAA